MAGLAAVVEKNFDPYTEVRFDSVCMRICTTYILVYLLDMRPGIQYMQIQGLHIIRICTHMHIYTYTCTQTSLSPLENISYKSQQQDQTLLHIFTYTCMYICLHITHTHINVHTQQTNPRHETSLSSPKNTSYRSKHKACISKHCIQRQLSLKINSPNITGTRRYKSWDNISVRV